MKSQLKEKLIALKSKLMDLSTPTYYKSVTFADYYFSRADLDTASNDGGREVVAVGFTTDITVAIGPAGVFYEHGSFRYKGKDYAVLTIGHALGVDVSVALNTFQIWADPSTFSPFDLAGKSTQENVSFRWFSGSSESPFSPGGHNNGSYLGTSQGFGFGVTLAGGSHVTGTTYVWEITPGPTLYDLYKSRPGGY